MTQKTLIIAAGILILFALVWIGTNSGAQTISMTHAVPEHADVVLTDKGFIPEQVSIKLHGTVAFSTDRNRPFWPASNLHPTHGIYPEFDPRGSLSPSGSWTFRFDKAGEWKYHDHLRSYFTGIIYVVE